MPGPRTVPPVMMPIVPRAFLAAVPVIEEREMNGHESAMGWKLLDLVFLVIRR